MSEPRYRTKSGRELTDKDIEALADEAEHGYDVSHLLVKRAERAERRVEVLKKALEEIQPMQQTALGYIKASGFVFDDIGNEPGNWKHLAFSLYTDLCQVESIASAALREAEEE